MASFLAGYLGHSCLVLLHQLVHVLLILFQPVLDLIFLTLKATQLLLQLDKGRGRSEGIRPVSSGPEGGKSKPGPPGATSPRWGTR